MSVVMNIPTCFFGGDEGAHLASGVVSKGGVGNVNCVCDDGRADQDIFDSLLLMMLMSVVVREEKVIVVDDVVADIGGVEVLGRYC